MPENGGFPCSIDGVRPDAARRTPGGQGEGQTAVKRLMGRMPNSQEGHRVARGFPNILSGELGNNVNVRGTRSG